MKATRRKIHNCEHNKKPKKMKLSTLKKSMEEGNANNNELNKLSTDIITSIFIRLPMKTLSMLRCASKSWNDFITSQLFALSYLEQPQQGDAELLFVEANYLSQTERFKPCRLRFFSVDMEGKRESNELYTVTVPDFSSWLVCYGLVCLSTCDRIYLCNPVMQKLCELPKGSPSIFPGPAQYGFGYLHSKKEYKVVRFFYREPMNHRPNLQLAHLRCEVFTLNGVGGIFNRWKETAEMPPSHPFTSGLLVNECMYWLAGVLLCPSTKPDRIVAFDFENEKFSTIPRPSSFETLSGVSMIDLKGMLCLPDMDELRRSSVLNLWILKDKISCMWVKEYSFNLVNYQCKNIRSSFSTWNEELIFIYSGMVVFVDLKRYCTRIVKSLPTNAFGIYQKSLFYLGST